MAATLMPRHVTVVLSGAGMVRLGRRAHGGKTGSMFYVGQVTVVIPFILSTAINYR